MEHPERTIEHDGSWDECICSDPYRWGCKAHAAIPIAGKTVGSAFSQLAQATGDSRGPQANEFMQPCTTQTLSEAIRDMRYTCKVVSECVCVCAGGVSERVAAATCTVLVCIYTLQG